MDMKQKHGNIENGENMPWAFPRWTKYNIYIYIHWASPRPTATASMGWSSSKILAILAINKQTLKQILSSPPPTPSFFEVPSLPQAFVFLSGKTSLWKLEHVKVSKWIKTNDHSSNWCQIHKNSFKSIIPPTPPPPPPTQYEKSTIRDSLCCLYVFVCIYMRYVVFICVCV